MVFDPYLNSALSKAAPTLKTALLSSGNVDVFRISLTKIFLLPSRKTPHFILAWVDAHIAFALERNSLFLVLVTILLIQRVMSSYQLRSE